MYLLMTLTKLLLIISSKYSYLDEGDDSIIRWIHTFNIPVMSFFLGSSFISLIRGYSWADATWQTLKCRHSSRWTLNLQSHRHNVRIFYSQEYRFSWLRLKYWNINMIKLNLFLLSQKKKMAQSEVIESFIWCQS